MVCRILLALLILTNTFIISGCWDRQEVNELRVIAGMAIELTNQGGYRVIAQSVNPGAVGQSMGGGPTFQKAYRNHGAEGDSLFEAFDNLSRETATKRFFAHTQVIIISEEVARERGVTEILDYLVRNPQFRLDTWLLIGRGDLKSLLDVPGVIETAPSHRIKQIADKLKDTNVAAPLTVGEFVKLLQSDSTQAYTAGVESTSNVAFVDGAGYELSDGNVPEPLRNTSVNSSALFQQDKLVGWLYGEESCGLKWLTGDTRTGFLSIDNPDAPGDKIGVTVLSSKVKLEPELQNGDVFMKINIEVESFVEDVQGKIDLDKVSAVSRLEAAQSNKVEEEIKAALQKAQQEYQVDVFGFGEAVHRSYPKEWKSMKSEWSEIFPDVQVDIQVKSKIRHTSLIGKPVQPGKE